jgi:hypothetical protein
MSPVLAELPGFWLNLIIQAPADGLKSVLFAENRLCLYCGMGGWEARGLGRGISELLSES